ncbi:recombination protein RecR [Treponema maltophilum ATCC 51939]|uniref:Recombination protein RecR n=1 Tax=Treponema maltophilum ATCC 51939 TaxID=1125699 RepID=S3K1P6_TREMA|nr:recombination mediator RecR [Treponema maltophilum]EPF32138.1 recombination protein RecR [Treponema maltophilum ATCC 51939]
MMVIDELADSFSRLPGIGKKTATRLVHHLLKVDQGFLERFAYQLSSLHSRITYCSVCGSCTESDPCPICTDPLRDKTLLCVVEQPQDIDIIEASHEYRGFFHVLGGLIAPLDGIGPEQLRIASLIERIHQGETEEVIIATPPTIEGDTTALYVNKLLSPIGIKVTRLASGLPVGGDLEYADKLTLARSFRGRTSL